VEQENRRRLPEPGAHIALEALEPIAGSGPQEFPSQIKEAAQSSCAA
jgi:hypothetical protein